MFSGMTLGMKGGAVDQAEKVRENRLRRMAGRQGLTLTRSRRRDPRALDFGLYWLTNRDGRKVGNPDGMSPDDVERYLTR
jgi:hypothetical protein